MGSLDQNFFSANLPRRQIAIKAFEISSLGCHLLEHVAVLMCVLLLINFMLVTLSKCDNGLAVLWGAVRRNGEAVREVGIRFGDDESCVAEACLRWFTER